MGDWKHGFKSRSQLHTSQSQSLIIYFGYLFIYFFGYPAITAVTDVNRDDLLNNLLMVMVATGSLKKWLLRVI